MRPIHIAAVVGINVVFAGAYIAGKIGVGHFPPLFFTAVRFLLVFVVLLPFFRVPPFIGQAAGMAPTRDELKTFAGFCFAMGIGVYAAMYLGLHVSDGVSSIYIGTQFSVPMAALLGVWLLKDKINRTMWAGIIMACSGVAVVGAEEALLEQGAAFSLILLSAFFYAYANVLSQKLAGRVTILNLNAWMALLSVPVMLVLSLLFEDGQWSSLLSADAGDWASLVYSSLVVSLIGHTGMFALLRHYPVAVIMPYYVLMPIFGVVFSIFIFDEIPSAKFYIGAAVALVGVYVVTSQARRRAAQA